MTGPFLVPSLSVLNERMYQGKLKQGAAGRAARPPALVLPWRGCQSRAHWGKLESRAATPSGGQPSGDGPGGTGRRITR